MTKAKRAAALIGITMTLAFPAGVVAASVASAVDCAYPATCESTGNITDTPGQTVAPTTDPGDTVAAKVKAATLPVTGGDILGLSMIGGAAFAVGAVLTRRTRRP
jgi:hypothetical protein